MRLSELITRSSERIISEWEVFARSCVPAANAMDLEQRRDHVASMLRVIARDLDTPQTPREQHEKAIGNDDHGVEGNTAANAHGSDRAASGYTPVQMVAEFRALRASVLRLWAEVQTECDRASLDDVTRFNEAVDQLLAESIAKYAHDVDQVTDLFLGVLGHDLRNPLGAIMMSTTLILSKEAPAWPQARTASRILASGTRMDRMIGDLLDFTRARRGAGMPMVRAQADLEVICRQAIDEIVAAYPQRAVSLEVTGDLHGQWDAARIAQALSNLLGNAQQHGDDRAAIEVVARGASDHVTVSVHNQGPAIPKRRLQDVFDPFRQLDPTTPTVSRGSVGLGLYIVQSIVSAHGGTIEVESSETAGTTFTIRLPRAA